MSRGNAMDTVSTFADRGSMQGRVEMYNPNKLKIGLFGANCSSSRTPTRVPERWTASWQDCVAHAELADQAGIDFLLPIGRWKGYGGESDFHGTAFETLTWASGILNATKRITVFGTVHAPLFHPLIAAKQMVTADHIGNGRFGLNLVAGWNEGEFAMFGVEQRAHEDRYGFTQEWIDVVKRAWSEDDFDFRGKYFNLSDVRSKPKPIGGGRPMIMNAGQSAIGQAFAMQNCDGFFTSTRAARLETAGQGQAGDEQAIFASIVNQVSRLKAEGKKYGRDIEVFTQGQVVCRPTQRDADDYLHYVKIENADWDAIDRMLALKNVTLQNTDPAAFQAKRNLMASTGVGGYAFVGTPDKIAEEFASLSRAGIRGLAVSFVNFLNDLPYFCAEVLPRLEWMGVRSKR